MRLRTVWKATALSLAAAMVIAPSALAQKPSAAESGLVGIKLFDNGLRLLSLYGQPDDIQPLGGGATSVAAPQGGGGPVGLPAGAGGGGGGGARGGGRLGGGGGARGQGGEADSHLPSGLGDDLFQLPPGYGGSMPPGFRPPGIGGGAGLPPGVNPGAPAQGGPPAGFNPGIQPTAPGQPPIPQAPSYSGSSQGFTRWIYKRDGGKYGFILDPKSRIVQIEAIGLEDKRVRTRKGLTFGASFVQVIKTYGWPDTYEVAGNAITMRYQIKNKVVFRLNRLGLDKPHVVTGILIAAAKS